MVDFRANHVGFQTVSPIRVRSHDRYDGPSRRILIKGEAIFQKHLEMAGMLGGKTTTINQQIPANSDNFLLAAKMPGLLRWSNSYGACFGRPTPYYHKGCWSSTLNQFLRPFQFGFQKQPVTTITWCVLPRVSQCQGPPFFVFPFFPLAAVTSSCVSTWAGWWVEVGSSQKEFLKIHWKSVGNVWNLHLVT